MKNSSAIESLKTDGFVNVRYPEAVKLQVAKTMDAWRAFCALPLDVIKGLPYSNDGAGVGYEYKEGIGNNADRKENFDISLGSEAWLDKNLDAIKSPEARNFVTEACVLFDLTDPIVTDFAQNVEDQFHYPGFFDEIVVSKDARFLRFINYFGDFSLEFEKVTELGEVIEIAVPHPDQSGVTFHLGESGPGLQRKTRDGSWVDMSVSDGQTVVIPAMQLQLLSNGELEATSHRVIVKPSTVHGRQSAVMFCQLSRTPKYDKAKHGRLQEKPAGFNYGMQYEEFKKFFK